MAVTIETDQCMGCGTCLAFCPQDLLELSPGHNARGVHPVILKDADACLSCGTCASMCPAHALSIPGRDKSFALLDRAHIPPHAGCPLGLMAKALARAICAEQLEERVVLYKLRASDVNMAVRSHDYEDDSYLPDALAHKRAHPEDIVVVICSSSKEAPTHTNEKRYRALTGEGITVINTLNWFEGDPGAGTLARGGSRIAEELAQDPRVGYVARSAVRTPADLTRLSTYIARALRCQAEGRGLSLVEFVYPCFYRVAGRPQELMDAESIAHIYRWFDELIAPAYPARELKR